MGPQSHRSHHEGHARSSSQRVRATEVLKAAPPTVPPGWQSLGGGPAGSFLRPWPAAGLHCWKAGCRETAPRMRGSRLGLRGSLTQGRHSALCCLPAGPTCPLSPGENVGERGQRPPCSPGPQVLERHVRGSPSPHKPPGLEKRGQNWPRHPQDPRGVEGPQATLRQHDSGGHTALSVAGTGGGGAGEGRVLFP